MTIVEENALLIPHFRVPALTVVVPVYKLFPERVKMPEPIFVRAPVVLVLAPEIVRVVPEFVISMVEVVPAVKVKLRLVDAVLPVYCSVPPLRTKFVATLVAAPRLPATPPLPMVATLKIPALIVVTPV